MICFFFIQVIAWMLPSKRNFHGPCHYWQHKLAANSYLIIFLLVFWKLLFSHSCVGLFMTPWPSACQASVLHCLPEFAQTYVHWVDDAIHPTISSSVAPFSSCPQSFAASGSFPMSWLFTSGGQSTGASASASNKRLPRCKTDNWELSSPLFHCHSLHCKGSLWYPLPLQLISTISLLLTFQLFSFLSLFFLACLLHHSWLSLYGH